MTQWGATPEDWAHFSGTLKLREHLLPVVSNPTAKISPKSVLKSLGQIPSRYNAEGFVSSFYDWTEKKSSIDDIKKWMKVPDYGICIQTRHARALDCDIVDPELAARVWDFIAENFPELPTRGRSNSSKFLKIFLMPGVFAKRVLHLDAKNKIEFLASGQQFIAMGTHPSGVKYEWAGGLPESVPEITEEQFNALWAALKTHFGATETKAGALERKPPGGFICDDPQLDYLEKHGHVLGYSDEGAAYIDCPFKAGHSKESDATETIYFPAGLRDYAVGHFHCLHASCGGRKDEDYLDAVGYRADMFSDLGALPAADTEAKPLKYQFIHVSDYVKLPPPEWIIRDILPRGELSALYGESTAGKTFVALNLAFTIARGIDWNGHPVKKGGVAYICAEDGRGARNRLKAYEVHNECSLAGLPFYLLPDSPNLLDKADAAEIIRSLRTLGKIDVVFIDTLAQTTPGSSEDSEDMGMAMSNCKRIHKATGALVIPVHHPGKDLSKGMRGWSGLFGAMDSVMEVSKSEDGRRFVKIIKQKNGEAGQEWGLNLISVPIDMDADQRVMSSCVTEYVEGAKRKPKQKQRGENEQAVIKAFDELGGTSCSVEDLIAKALEFIPKDPEKRDQRRSWVRRAIGTLGRDEIFTVSADRVEIIL